MFFEEGNCRAIRLLHKASHFLEDCIEKLVVLEQEALSELNNETIQNKNETASSVKRKNVKLNLNSSPSSSSVTDDETESTCLSNSEKNSPCDSEKIRLLGSDEESPITPETSSKRKIAVDQPPNENLKKSKWDQSQHRLDKDMLENLAFHKNQLSIHNKDIVLENSSKSIIKSVDYRDDFDENVSSSKLISENFTSIADNVSQKEQKSSSELISGT